MENTVTISTLMNKMNYNYKGGNSQDSNIFPSIEKDIIGVAMQMQAQGNLTKDQAQNIKANVMINAKGIDPLSRYNDDAFKEVEQSMQAFDSLTASMNQGPKEEEMGRTR